MGTGGGTDCIESGMSSLAMAGVAGTMKLPADIDGGPDEVVEALTTPFVAASPFSMTLTPLMVTEVGSPISKVAVEVGTAGGGTFGLCGPFDEGDFVPFTVPRESFLILGGGCGGLAGSGLLAKSMLSFFAAVIILSCIPESIIIIWINCH